MEYRGQGSGTPRGAGGSRQKRAPVVPQLRSTPLGGQQYQPSPAQNLTPRVNTPSSSRSAHSVSFTDLEDTIQSVMGVRMQSLSDLRARIDELGDLQRREEAAFRDSIVSVLDQSEAAKEAQREAEDDMIEALDRERNQRQRALDMMAMFKREGGRAIERIKDNLKEVQHKYKLELDKNAKLTAQLRRYENAGLGSRGGPVAQYSDPMASGGNSEETDALRRKIDTLAQLLEDEDAVVVELQRRNVSLEQTVRDLQGQKQRAFDDQSDAWQSGPAAAEFRQLMSFVSTCDIDASNLNRVPAARVGHALESHRRFAKLAVQRLKIEQRQRLRVEEQSARIAAAQDEQVQKLEGRVKELEAILRGTHGSVGGSSPPATSRSTVVGTRSSQGGPRVPNSLQGTDRTHESVSSNSSAPPPQAFATSAPAATIAEPRQQETIGLDNIPSPAPDEPLGKRSISGGGGSTTSGGIEISEVTETYLYDGHQHHNEAVAGSGSREELDNAVGGGDVPSLEQHLAAVATEFHASMAEWKTAMKGIDLGFDDDDLMPETPSKQQ